LRGQRILADDLSSANVIQISIGQEQARQAVDSLSLQKWFQHQRGRTVIAAINQEIVRLAGRVDKNGGGGFEGQDGQINCLALDERLQAPDGFTGSGVKSLDWILDIVEINYHVPSGTRFQEFRDLTARRIISTVAELQLRIQLACSRN